jgi:hypothetical protein
MSSYDVFLCFHPKDQLIFDYCLPSIRKYLSEANTIYVVSEEKPETDETIVWIPETSYPFQKKDVERFITRKERIGWYYQQLLKMYMYEVLPSQADHILIVDSDVIFKEHVSFFENNSILLGTSPEHHEPYFEHMKNLLQLEKQTEYSGIVHHMMTKRNHIKEILETIESIHKKPAWQALLEFVNPIYYGSSGMSEYEIIFNYCLKYHPDSYKIRILPFANCANFQDFLEQKVAFVALHAWLLH